MSGNPNLAEVVQTFLPQIVATLGVAVSALIVVLVMVGVGVLVGWLARRATGRLARPLGNTRSILLSRVAAYGAYAGAVVIGFWWLGVATGVEFDWILTTIAGAAGIVGIAAGFASQTSAANVISGIFLVGERPFDEGDIVNINGVVGVVIAVDLMSVKLRTFENTFVRVPNETVMKATIINNSRFPIRRMDLSIFVPPQTELDEVRAVVRAVCDANPRVLVEPSSNVIFQEITERGVKLLLVAWTTQEDFGVTRAAWSVAMAARLEQAGIDVLGRTRWERDPAAVER